MREPQAKVWCHWLVSGTVRHCVRDMWDASFLCVCVRAHNLGLIIKALLLADAQTRWQTNRQADTEHSSTGSYIFFIEA